MLRYSIIKILFFVFSFLSLTILSYSQVVYEPLYKDVYDFLSRLSAKGVIEYNDEMRPLPRKYLAEKLIEAEKHPEL